MKRLLIILTTTLLSAYCNAQVLRIGVFSDISADAFVFSVATGKYLLSADNRAIITLSEGQNIFAKISGDSIELITTEKQVGTFVLLQFKALTDSAVFGLKPVLNSAKTRFYDDNLELCVNLGRIQPVNLIDMDKYIAGVVESEGGLRATPEYYKTQAVLCRTYAISHLDRHTGENYYLCDRVHCQAYNGVSSAGGQIAAAALQTRGLVVIDPDSVLITAAFFSNCGGTTENAENVWLINKSYLKSVQDPYCQNQRNYSWEQKISLDNWRNYLYQQGFKAKPDVAPSYFNSTQLSRKTYYKIGNDSVSFKKLRTDFNLKSTYFSVLTDGNNIVFSGRGFGHGVGLCQEGAMQMSKLRYNFREIIQFYYQSVNITHYQYVPKSKNPSLGVLYSKH